MPRPRRAFTLPELAAATGASAVLVLAMGTALWLTAATLPTETEPAVRAAEADLVLGRVLRDAVAARSWSIKGANACLELTVGDRDGDGTDDAIVYERVVQDGAGELRRTTRAATVVLLGDLEGLSFFTTNLAGGTTMLTVVIDLEGDRAVSVRGSAELLAGAG